MYFISTSNLQQFVRQFLWLRFFCLPSRSSLILVNILGLLCNWYLLLGVIMVWFVLKMKSVRFAVFLQWHSKFPFMLWSIGKNRILCIFYWCYSISGISMNFPVHNANKVLNHAFCIKRSGKNLSFIYNVKQRNWVT